jgi:hypothetical protein
VVRRFHHDDFGLGEVDTELREQVGAEALGAMCVEDDLDAVDLYDRDITEWRARAR